MGCRVPTGTINSQENWEKFLKWVMGDMLNISSNPFLKYLYYPSSTKESTNLMGDSLPIKIWKSKGGECLQLEKQEHAPFPHIWHPRTSSRAVSRVRTGLPLNARGLTQWSSEPGLRNKAVAACIMGRRLPHNKTKIPFKTGTWSRGGKPHFMSILSPRMLWTHCPQINLPTGRLLWIKWRHEWQACCLIYRGHF